MTPVSIDVKYLNSFFAISRGLMFADNSVPVFFKTRFGIHTFFVKHPIDVLILDNDHKIVKLKANLKPWSVFVWNPKYVRVLELPSGNIKRMKLKVGSMIKLSG